MTFFLISVLEIRGKEIIIHGRLNLRLLIRLWMRELFSVDSLILYNIVYENALTNVSECFRVMTENYFVICYCS